ncbi:MAG: NifU family protein [Alphaproteobacteria bacterium]|nr:NifU family protein [Alphaproteobacteria bacterium]
MFIQTEQTPNPATLKFLPGQPVMTFGVAEFINAGDAASSPLAKALFTIDGVERVFLGSDFVTITKSATKEWATLKPHVLAAIMDHLLSGLPAVSEQAAAAPTNENDSDVVKQICELIEQRVRPAVAQDGGDITFNRFEEGVVYLNLKGSCAGCPSSTATLKSGIENMLKHYIPEVIEVRQVS